MSVADLVDSFTNDVWNDRRLDLLDRITVEDYELHNLGDGSVPIKSRQELREHIESWHDAFPDLRMTEIERVEDPGSRLASVVVATGTHTGTSFMSVEPAGARIEVTMVAIFAARDGRLASHGTLLDAHRLVAQLAG